MSTANQEAVLYDSTGGIATLTMQGPMHPPSRSTAMTGALDAAFRRASEDDQVKVIVLRGAGRHFSVGYDSARPGGALPSSRRHAAAPGAESPEVREQDAYLGMCRSLRELPKPTIAMVRGACISDGLMLAWACDLIVAAADAFFSDPMLCTGMQDVAYFAHAYELNPRVAKEFLFLGERASAQRAFQMGMINRVVPREFLEEETLCIAMRIAQMPPVGLALAKHALNRLADSH